MTSRTVLPPPGHSAGDLRERLLRWLSIARGCLERWLTAATVYSRENPGTAMVVCFTFVFLTQLLSLRSILTASAEQELWSQTKMHRQQWTVDQEEQLRLLSEEIAMSSRRLGDIRAELASATDDRDRIATDLAEVRKRLSLAVDTEAESIRTRKAAVEEASAATEQAASARKNLTELMEEKAKLEADFTDSQKLKEPLLKEVEQSKSILAGLNIEISAARRQSSALHAQSEVISDQLDGLRTQLIKEAQTLDNAVTENGMLTRKREALLQEISSAERTLTELQLVQNAKDREMQELLLAVEELSQRKKDGDAIAAALQQKLDELSGRIAADTKELESVEKKVSAARAEEKRLLDSIKELSGNERGDNPNDPGEDSDD